MGSWSQDIRDQGYHEDHHTFSPHHSRGVSVNQTGASTRPEMQWTELQWPEVLYSRAALWPGRGRLRRTSCVGATTVESLEPISMRRTTAVTDPRISRSEGTCHRARHSSRAACRSEVPGP